MTDQNKNIISAVFPSHAEAEKALTQLRLNGVPDDAISIVARHEKGAQVVHPDGTEAGHDVDSTGSGMAKGATAGAAVGALFGLAAFFIPGVGPFITAGAMAATLGAAGGAAVSGAIVGGVAGGLAGAIMNYGVSKDDAEFYESQIQNGGVLVLVDSRKVPENVQVQSILSTQGGRTKSAYVS